MLGLPKSTELSKQLPKTAIYKKFNMNSAAQEKFDADISRITIVGEISPNTVNIDKGESVTGIFVLLVALKKKDYDEKTIIQLTKLIDQNILLVLRYEEECRLAIYRGKLLQGDWKSIEDSTIVLQGLNLDAVWDGFNIQIGNIDVQQGNTVDEQIKIDDEKAKLQKEIMRLEKLARAEKQPKKKFELVSNVKILKKQLADYN